MIKPISLRLRPDEVTERTKRMLRQLDREISQQRRIKWLAMKALAEIYQMEVVATARLKSMSDADRADWQANYKMLVATLRKISQRGVL